MVFRRRPADVVFVGAGLGVMSPERVAAKIREVKPWGVRLIRIVDSDGEQAGECFDGVIVRSSSPDAVRRAIQPLVAGQT